MGKKKSQQHLQQSMGNLVSRAALAQMGPSIENYVQQVVRQLGSQLAVQQASTLETIFARVVVLETIIMEKFDYTSEDLARLVADNEDQKENLVTAESVEVGDVTRLEISTKTKDQEDYQGTSRLKVYNTGSGESIGEELEKALIGMKSGETKEVQFGKDQEMSAKITMERVSRKVPAAPVQLVTPEVPSADPVQG